MRMVQCARGACSVVMFASWVMAGAAQRTLVRLQPEGLTVEMRTAPMGVAIAGTPRFGWLLVAPAGLHGVMQAAYEIQVASSADTLRMGQPDMWDSGRVSSQTFWQVQYAGTPLRPHTTYWWRVRAWSDARGTDETTTAGKWSEAAVFTTGLGAADWKAKWIAATLQLKAGQGAGPLPVFRTDFEARKRVKRALLFVSGLGQYEVRLNGANVTDTVLNPGWTDYRKTVLYDSYDVTPQVQAGGNALAVLLGNGMYHVADTPGRFSKFTGSFGVPKLRLQMVIDYQDGTEQQVTTDGQWTSHAGPVTFSSTYGGEDFDARVLPLGWDKAGFAAAGWSPALEVDGPGGKMVGAEQPPMRVAERRTPVQITHPRPGMTVYDLGKNMSGWPEIAVHGEAGSQLTLLPGELLNPDGAVTQRSDAATPKDPVLFRYILRGGGTAEHWHPRFSYYGFRYVQVTEAAAAPGGALPTVEALQGDFVHAAVTDAGSFASSDSLFDRIHALIDRAVLSNLASIVTDCPTREKLGWLEQTYLNAGTLMLNYDVSGLYEKMTRDMEDAQLPDGLEPGIAPEFVAFVDGQGKSTVFRDSPEWGSALVLSPWALFQLTGDDEPLREAYPAMQRYVAYLGGKAKGHLLDYGLGDWYDVGPGEPGVSKLTGLYVTGTATYYEDLTVMARIAKMLGHGDEASYYDAEAGQVRDAFNAKLFDPATGRYDRGSQTAEAMPLALGMVPAGHEQQVLEQLVAAIRAHTDHVTAGDVGFHYVVRALTEAGRGDVLAAMLSRTDAPSYGYQLAQGATTLTEAWDSNPASSQNHFMLGHGEEWFYRGLAGLRIDMARGAEDAIQLRPATVDGVDSVSASYRTAMGVVRSGWTRGQSRVEYAVTIPTGARATLWLPVDGDAVKTGDGVLSVEKSNGLYQVRLGSGAYRFTSPISH